VFSFRFLMVTLCGKKARSLRRRDRLRGIEAVAARVLKLASL
jgi:hypothetical protein